MNKSLLIVDDDSHVVKCLKRALHREEYDTWSADSGLAGLDLLGQREIGVVISDCMMPGMDGICFLTAVKDRYPDTARILLTAYGSLNGAMEAINRAHLFGYMTKPWSTAELQATVNRGFEHYELVRENKRLLRLTEHQNRQLRDANQNLETTVSQRTAELELSVRESIFMLAKAAEAKDDQTGQHIYRIRAMTEAICRRLGFSSDQVESVGLASIMHDIGKIHVPDRILQKCGPLNADEWRIMKTHTLAGERILGDQPVNRLAREIARSHHEQWNGSGYPDGLKGEETPVAARIVTVGDIYDALTHQRPYKPAWTKTRALEEIRKLSGTTLDPRIVSAFLQIHAEVQPQLPE